MNTQIYQEACDWFVDFRTGDVDSGARKRFAAWIRKSPEHLRAYLEVTEIWQDAERVRTTDEESVQTLIEAARAPDENVASLQTVSGPPRGEPRARQRGPVRWRALAASILLAGAFAATGGYFYLQRDTYATTTGEQRILNLADGSVIQLNAQTRIRVRYSAGERAIDLLQGQALFRVAKDRRRPFLVRSDDAQVRAVGTQFDVYRKHSGTVVTVVEGTVAVLPSVGGPYQPPSTGTGVDGKDPSDSGSGAVNSGAGADSVSGPANEAPRGGAAEERRAMRASAGEMLLTAGDQLTLDAHTTPQVVKDKGPEVLAWTQHQLIFKGSPLSVVVEEFNRYSTRRLIIESLELEDLRVSGVYTSTDPTVLIRFLREQPGIQIRESDDEIRISRVP